MVWANEFANLANDISDMHKERADHIRDLNRDIKQTKNNWNAERAKMKTEFLANFKTWDKTRANEVAELRSLTQALLTELNKGDKARAKEVNDLKGAVQMSLKNFRDEDMAGFKKENKDRAQNIARFKLEVGKMISEFKKDRDFAAAAWQELVSGIAPGQKKKIRVKEEVGKGKKQSRKKKA